LNFNIIKKINKEGLMGSKGRKNVKKPKAATKKAAPAPKKK
jgi:hypothetical protein